MLTPPAENETELSLFNRADYEAFKVHPEVSRVAPCWCWVDADAAVDQVGLDASVVLRRRAGRPAAATFRWWDRGSL